MRATHKGISSSLRFHALHPFDCTQRRNSLQLTYFNIIFTQSLCATSPVFFTQLSFFAKLHILR